MTLDKLRAKLAATVEEENHLESSPSTAFAERRKVTLCRRRSRLENQIADAEFEQGRR